MKERVLISSACALSHVLAYHSEHTAAELMTEAKIMIVLPWYPDHDFRVCHKLCNFGWPFAIGERKTRDLSRSDTGIPCRGEEERADRELAWLARIRSEFWTLRAGSFFRSPYIYHWRILLCFGCQSLLEVLFMVSSVSFPLQRQGVMGTLRTGDSEQCHTHFVSSVQNYFAPVRIPFCSACLREALTHLLVRRCAWSEVPRKGYVTHWPKLL